MKKAWRSTKGKCATYSSLTFESHELFRLCSIATVISFSVCDRAPALCQRFSKTWSARGVTGIIADFFSSSVCVSMIMTTRRRSIACFRFFKNRNPGYRQVAFPARLLLSASNISVPCAVKKKYLKRLVQLFSRKCRGLWINFFLNKCMSRLPHCIVTGACK